ncbi:hypothetical protein BgiMline_005967, partial [Biomphalaria glabrata]
NSLRESTSKDAENSRVNYRLKKQRDELSSLLNEMKQLYGQQSCKMLKLEN